VSLTSPQQVGNLIDGSVYGQRCSKTPETGWYFLLASNFSVYTRKLQGNVSNGYCPLGPARRLRVLLVIISI